MKNRMTFIEVLNRVAEIDCKVMDACNPEVVTVRNHAIILEGRATAKRIADLYAVGIELRHEGGETSYFMATVSDNMFIRLKV